MNFKVQDAEALTILGIHARAANEDLAQIGDLWRRFQAMGGPAAIAARQNDAVYCVYCEYETDATGPFTVLIGCAVDADAEVPEEMKVLTVDAGRFFIFETWAEIWNMPVDRRYQADYDRYGSDGKVTIHLGVR